MTWFPQPISAPLGAPPKHSPPRRAIEAEGNSLEFPDENEMEKRKTEARSIIAGPPSNPSRPIS